MRISGIGVNNTLFNANAVNQSVRGNVPLVQRGAFAQQGNRDSVFISEQGKKESIIQGLMKQKQLIQENKNAEMERGMKEGYINSDKLKEYDKQLEMIDKQIAEATVNQDTEKENQKVSSTNKVMSKDEYERTKMNNMLNMAFQANQVEVISSVKKRLDGEAEVLKSEIKTDGSGALDSKKERVAEIEQQSENLIEQVGSKIADINEDIKESQDNVSVEDDDNSVKNDSDEDDVYVTHPQDTIMREENSDSEEMLYDANDK